MADNKRIEIMLATHDITIPRINIILKVLSALFISTITELRYN